MTNRLQLADRTSEARRSAVAIVGFTDHRAQAPLGDPRFEIWGLNELYRYMDLGKFHRWFELHPRSDFERAEGGDPEHIKALQAFPIPVYMQQAWLDIPKSQALPKQLIETRVSGYMTSSIAWMIGLAIAEGFEEIHVYGVDMAQDTEYAEQRPCCEYLLGIAQGRGIKIHMPQTSDLLKAVAQYGFESEGNTFVQKLLERLAWLQKEHGTWTQRLADLEKQYTEKSADLRGQYEGHKATMLTNLRQVEGAIDDCRYWKRSWGVQATAAEGVPANPLDRGLPRVAFPGAADARVPGATAAIVTAQVVQPPAGDSPRALAPVGG